MLPAILTCYHYMLTCHSVILSFRDDGKEGLKFYTDPNFFFELWCMEMQKDVQAIKDARRRKQKVCMGVSKHTFNI